MKKMILLCSALLALTATAASAAGVCLRWNDCFNDGTAGATGAHDRISACTSNFGNAGAFYGGFKMDTDLANVSGTEVIVDIASASATLPAWWDLVNPTACRPLALSWGLINPGADCIDWASLQASGGIGAYNVGQRGPNTARIITASAVANPVGLPGGLEFYAFTGTVQNLATTGVGACAGCSTPVCIVLNSINITTPIAANNRKLTGATNGTDSDFVTWQGGGQPVVGAVTGCPAATPTRSSTWGQVKALYH